jgi:hypothetical protein
MRNSLKYLLGILSLASAGVLFWFCMNFFNEGIAWSPNYTLILIGLSGVVLIAINSFIVMFYDNKIMKMLRLFFPIAGFLFSVFLLVVSINALYGTGKASSGFWGAIGIVCSILMAITTIVSFVKILKSIKES